jgi:PQQ-dependent catabolism-associated CXXCW motif protein
MRAWRVSLVLIAVAPISLASPIRAEVQEPPDIWSGPMHGETPATLAGAKVVDADAVAKLKDSDKAVLLDVAETPKKPEKISSDAPWLPIHLTIPGAVWLANAGLGNPDPEFQRRFGERVAGLTRGDKGRPLVVFCHPHCWGSWNAAKRLVMLGYAKVFWFPEGVEGWQEKFSTTPIKEDAAWNEMNR